MAHINLTLILASSYPIRSTPINLNVPTAVLFIVRELPMCFKMKLVSAAYKILNSIFLQNTTEFHKPVCQHYHNSILTADSSLHTTRFPILVIPIPTDTFIYYQLYV